MDDLPLRTAIMIQQIRRRLSGNRGQTLIEFALIAPLMIIFLFVIVDFGLALDRRSTVQHAVREGGRRGAVTDDIGSVIDRTVAQSQGLLEAGDVTVCYEDVGGNGNPGDPGDSVRVSATFTYNFTIAFAEIFNAFGASIPSGIVMTPSADMRLENSVGGAPPC